MFLKSMVSWNLKPVDVLNMAAYDKVGPIPHFDWEDDIDDADLINASQAVEALEADDMDASC